MATRTPYYGLTKPAGIEDAQVSVINANMDILDTELHLTTVRDAKNLAPIYDATSSYVEGDYVTYLITGQSSQDANGYFVFKCIEDTTTPAGNFDTNKWEAVCITDEMGSGGGGGGEGGHIFLDNEGTAMPQRAKAKFEGAYSTDNSTDGITNVAVMRTMKAMEYAQLTEEEKQGIIYVDDETTGTDDKFQPVMYSTEEREIGVWVDGKPLYQKTYTNVSLSNNSDATLETNVSEFEIKDFEIDFIGVSANVSKLRNCDDSLYVNNSGSLIYWINASSWYVGLSVANITVRYTKTTDTAGSGQWTPQGVPAVHYSTDEQVIGTWIDGKTLYQKTVIKDSNFVSGANQIAHNISNIGKIISDESTLYYKNGDCVPLPSISTTAWSAKTRDFGSTYLYLDLGSSMLSYVASASFTLRYTKASS